MASSGVRSSMLRLTAAAIAVLMLSMVVAYAFWTTKKADATIPPPSNATPVSESPALMLVPQDPSEVPSVIQAQAGPHIGQLMCGPGYTTAPLAFHANQEVGGAQVGIRLDPGGLLIYALPKIPGDSLIVDGRLTAEIPQEVNPLKILLPDSYFHPQGWMKAFGPGSKITLCLQDRFELAA